MASAAIRFALGMMLAMGLLGCAGHPPERRFEYARVCMGVRASVALYARDGERAERAAAAAFARIGELDDAMSDYRGTSELMRLCARPREWVWVSEDLFRVLQEGQRVAAASDGAFDVTIGPAGELWRRARTENRLPEASAVEAARGLVDWQSVELEERGQMVALRREGVRLDLGGIAKGYAAQRAVEVLRREGCSRCLVAISGDIAAGDAPPGERGWRVAIQSERGGRSMGMVWLTNAAVSTSGDTEQFVEIGGERYSHIIDPRTMLGMTARRCVAVVSERGEWADALATAVCVVGVERGRAVIAGFRGTGAVIEEAGEGGELQRSIIDPGGVIRWCRE